MPFQNKISAVAILGGDDRQSTVAYVLASKGYSLHLWGLPNWRSEIGNDVTVYDDWQSCICNADAVLLPIPATLDGVRVNAPSMAEAQRPRLDLLFREIEGRVLLGGRLSEQFFAIAEVYGIECCDYFASECLQLKNALSTAEGAIFVAMKELSVTLDGAETAVIGYGRIGELLAQKLYLLGAKVTVYARREEVLTRARLSHLNAVMLNEASLKNMNAETKVIFNTVPECIFTETILPFLPPTCLFVDLASAPGGIDRLAAEKARLKMIWATALPGKYAPETAGIHIAETIEAFFEKRT